MNPNQATAEAMDTEGTSTSGGGGSGGAGPSMASLGHGRGLGQVAVQAQNFENAWSMLFMARQLIDQGQPSVALQMVMAAIRSHGGENAVLQTLQRARELYRNKVHENAAADELASLFAECAIAEAQPANANQPQATPPQPQPFDVNVSSTQLNAVANANDTSILAVSGRKQIMLDAFSDGSSFICLKCGGLVSNDRKDEHLAYWCGKC